jgi:hypothetical protein
MMHQRGRNGASTGSGGAGYVTSHGGSMHLNYDPNASTSAANQQSKRGLDGEQDKVKDERTMVESSADEKSAKSSKSPETPSNGGSSGFGGSSYGSGGGARDDGDSSRDGESRSSGDAAEEIVLKSTNGSSTSSKVDVRHPHHQQMYSRGHGSAQMSPPPLPPPQQPPPPQQSPRQHHHHHTSGSRASDGMSGVPAVVQLAVPDSFVPCILGTKGSTLRDLMNYSGANIKVRGI